MRGQPGLYVSNTPAKQAAARDAKTRWNPCRVSFQVFADSFGTASQEPGKLLDA